MAKSQTKSVLFFTKYPVFIVDVKSGRFMYQSGRVGDEAKKRKSPAKSGRVSITAFVSKCQSASQAKGFLNSFIQHAHHVHRLFLLYSLFCWSI